VARAIRSSSSTASLRDIFRPTRSGGTRAANSGSRTCPPANIVPVWMPARPARAWMGVDRENLGKRSFFGQPSVGTSAPRRSNLVTVRGRKESYLMERRPNSSELKFIVGTAIVLIGLIALSLVLGVSIEPLP
jgi:hypothetical protein